MSRTAMERMGILAGVVWLLLSPLPSQSAERFVNNGDGTITDNKAKLVGLARLECYQKRNWDEAMTAVSKLASGMCGLSDGSPPGSWRLPSKKELPILQDWKKSGQFVGARADFYWSSTPNEEDPTLAWLFFITTGYVGNDVKTDKNEVWPVREIIQPHH
ncbi:MAG: DUF1566 domain-containing protein [Magnetococcus sp. XQGC-1]